MSNVRVLIVDDEEMIRRGMIRAVHNLDYQVDEAADGEGAMAAIQANEYDVVVSDIRMPGMDGIELLKLIAKRDPDIPVILMSGAPSLETALMAIEYRAFRYLTKPFHPQEFQRVVQHAARLRQLARLKSQALAISGSPGGREGGFEALEAGMERLMGSFWMAYQPIVQAADHSIFGYEALLRTEEPSLPHPGAAFQAATRLQCEHRLGRAVRERAVGPIAMAGGRDVLFLNLNPSDLADEELLAPDSPIASLAWRTILEITERASLESVPDAADRVALLRERGFRIAVDDLGAGYAGLTSFATLEPDFVKIDMSLVRGVDRDPVRQKLIRSLNKLCEEMSIQVIAEGIETPDERDTIIDLGCDFLQGYLLARPGPPFPEMVW
jgi:EAL domain-containing protein (putative c-di-GMP-specific phosphodiesterase class I)